MNDAYKIKVHYHTNQKKVFFDSLAKVKVVAKGRRWGFTKGCANYVSEKMLEGFSPVLWVDTVNTNIDRYVERYFYPILRPVPKEMWKWRQQKKELSILDSKLDLRSADRPELIEGFAYKLIILNEAGIILKSKYLWENTIRPMIMDFNPDQIIGGTPKGQNLFHDLKVKAEDTQDPRYKDWEFFHFTSYDNPYLDRAEIDTLVADMPEHVKRQEIFAEFLEDSAAVFRGIEKCIGSQTEKPNPDKNYYAGLDLAKHVDFTVLTILDVDGNQRLWRRVNKLDWGYQKSLIIDIIRNFNARLVMDSTGVGDPIFDDLVNAGLDVIGYKFTSDSKKKLVENLMLSVEQKKVTLLDEPIQTNEMKIFGYEITGTGIKYSAPEGKHDDCVMALALAEWGRINTGGSGEAFVLG